MADKPMVALVGRPNVGKSSLFNRLVGERLAVVHDIPGTTRDRISADAEWQGRVFTVVDTGGLEVYRPKGSRDTSPLSESSAEFVLLIRAQAEMAIREADVIVMVTDVEHGVTAADMEVAEVLRRTKKPVMIAANKADNQERRDAAVEFYGLGLGEVFAVSALHGTGVGDLLDAVIEVLPFAPLFGDEGEDTETLKIAIVGRPNVGKSSLLNRLLGEDRAIVSPLPGTTRDAIDTRLTWEGMPVTLIDTAGIRRRGRIEPGVEQYSVLRALRAIRRADVAVLLIDAVENVTAQDTHIAGMVLEEYKGLVIAVNKWDVVDKDSHTTNEYIEHIRRVMDFADFAPLLFISALTGQRVQKVIPMAAVVRDARRMRLSTSEVNKIVRNALARQAPPIKAGRRLKIYFASQVSIEPPTFIFHVNDPDLVHFTYRRYLENRLREYYPFTGTPIRMSFRKRKSDRR